MIRAAMIAVAVAAVPGLALAHPLDEVVQGAYLTLTAGGMKLQLELTPGALVAGSVVRFLDADGDRRVTEPEARAYAERVVAQSALVIDSKPAVLKVTKVTAPSYEAVLQGAPIKIEAVAARLDQVGEHTLRFDNRYAPADSRCIANVFLQPGSGWSYGVAAQQHSLDGRTLEVRYRTQKL